MTTPQTLRTLLILLASALLTLPACGGSSGGSGSSGPQCNPACTLGTTCVFADASGTVTTCQPVGSSGATGSTSGATGATSGATGGGSGGCGDIIDCILACPEGQAGCADNCTAQGSAQGNSDLQALVNCDAANSCSFDPNCLSQNCPNETSLCLTDDPNPTGPTGGDPTGATSGATGGGECGTITEVGQCDGNILSYCNNLNLVTGDCSQVGPNCPCGMDQNNGGYDCICTENTTTGGGGDSGCNDILACWGNCTETDDACYDACVQNGTPQGQADLNALLQCDQTNQCNADQNCLGTSCSSQLAACEGGPVDTSGSCVGNCGGQSPDGCYCDDLCSQYGDCCDDIEAACG